MTVKCECIGWLVVAAVGLGLAGCGDPDETLEVGLEEMGYTATIEDFQRAAEIGDVAVMERLMEEGVAADGVAVDGDTALHAAAATGSGLALVFLLDEGLEVDLRGAGNRTPLMAAASANQVEAVRHLLRAGAKPELEDTQGYRAITLAADGGHTEAIEVLAVYSREDLDAALLLASLRGHSEAVGMLADFGASVYARMDDGFTPLMLAAREGHEETVRVLRDRGANRYAVDEEDRTAGQIAREAGHTELAEILNQAPGEEEFALPALPELGDEDVVVDGALLGALAGAVVGEKDEAAPAVGVRSVAESGDDGPLPGSAGSGQGGETDSGNASSADATKNEIVGATTDEGEKEGKKGAVIGAALGGSAGYRIGPAAENEPEDTLVPEESTAVVRPGANPAPDQHAGTGPPREPLEGRPADGTPALVMERYEDKVLPLRVEGVEGKEARVRYLYGKNETITVQEGEEIPLTGLRVIKVEQRSGHGKSTGDRPVDVSVVVVEDPATGKRRELVARLGASAHEPFAVLNDGGTPIVARQGAVVTESKRGGRYKVLDVRPSQVVLENLANGVVHTLPLRKRAK